MRREKWLRFFIFAALVAGILGLTGLAAAAQTVSIDPESWAFLFGFGRYPDPGGTLHTVFEIQRTPGVPIRTYTTDITPDGDQYLMTETIDAPSLALDQIETGLGGAASVAAVAGGRYTYGQTDEIDLSPLGALQEHGVEVEPNQTYYLPDGASFVTGEIEQISGVEVIKGTFTHPEYPSQIAVIGTALDSDITALLQYPVYIRIEMDGVVQSLTQLIEFSYEKP